MGKVALADSEQFVNYVPVYSPLKRGRGQPTKYDPRYCDEIVEFMGRGFSLSAYSDYVQIDRSTINHWVEKHPEFFKAVAQGKAARLRFWEQLGIEVAQTGGNGSQATMIIFGLKNMGSDEWRDKQEVAHTGQVTLATLVETSMRAIEGQLVDVTPIYKESETTPLEDDLFS